MIYGSKGLRLTSLDGLGPKSQIIRLNKMDELEDISAIKEATTVNIKSCSLTVDSIISSFVHLKELSIDFKVGETIPFLRSLKRLEQLKHLKGLKLNIPFSTIKDHGEIKELILIVEKYCIDL